MRQSFLRGVSVRPDAEGCVVEFLLPPLHTTRVSAAGAEHAPLQVEGYGRAPEPGLPRLPLVAINLVLNPSGTPPEIEILEMQQETGALDLPRCPTQEPRSKDRALSERPFVKNSACERTTGTPPPLVSVSEPFTVALVRGVTVSIRPFSYQPLTGLLSTVSKGGSRIRMHNSAPFAVPHSAIVHASLASVFSGHTSDLAPFYGSHINLVYWSKGKGNTVMSKKRLTTDEIITTLR